MATMCSMGCGTNATICVGAGFLCDFGCDGLHKCRCRSCGGERVYHHHRGWGVPIGCPLCGRMEGNIDLGRAPEQVQIYWNSKRKVSA